ncbi:MAG: UvrD-helicase domain-containing protein [Planctomycetota bacterium]
MKKLPLQPPTKEQLPIIQNTRAGFTLIRGAAGSGKTTTALLRIRQLVGFWLARRERLKIQQDVRVLVVTFNRTLRGYISDLAKEQLSGKTGLSLKVATFSNLGAELLGPENIIDAPQRKEKIQSLGIGVPLQTDFLVDEVEYVLGRFESKDKQEYVTCERTGRGQSPRVPRQLRQQIVSDVIAPYETWKQSHGMTDWDDLAVMVSQIESPRKYDIIIVDESQDLSANQVRGLLNVAADPSSVTFILDAAQRIYPKGFTWAEVGISVLPNDIYRLEDNHRNTVEICQFAKPLLRDMKVGDDGTFPNFETCKRHGPKPRVVAGLYRDQIRAAIDFISSSVDLSNESVAFLKPLGGRWFDTVKNRLRDSGLDYVEITRVAEWPEGDENIALSTMSSAKGLEFDHVIILGLNGRNTTYKLDDEDETCSVCAR